MKFAVALVLTLALSYSSGAPVIDSSLAARFQRGETVDIMIQLKAPAAQVVDSINSRAFVNSVTKTTAMVAELKAFTQASQREILSILEKAKIGGVQSFWITNRISVVGASAHTLELLAGRSDIEEIRAAKVIYLEDTKPEYDVKALEWGVRQIRGPEAWAEGHDGAGIIVSAIDTGVRPTHECLRDNRRTDGYDWFDPYAGTAIPNDGNGHGTHTMGTICGTGGTGVAPGSTWMACKGCSTNSCTEAALLGCAQWTTCPTRADGTGQDCSKKPHLSSNSWGGGNEDAWYDDSMNAWRAADIAPIFAIGNSGPGCRSANSPGDRAAAIAVGATTLQDAVASFSSHGPSQVALRIKPDCSAPGQNVRSASHTSDTGYSILSGTSMACPHVAGAYAVLKSKTQSASIDEIATALYDSAVRPDFGNVVCTGGGVNITYPWPNNSFGWGRIDVRSALDRIF